MYKIILVVLLCLAVISSHSQSKKTLGIGDTIPEINVHVLTGSGVVVRPLSSFYKKSFVILDFWANWCAPCIAAIADADSVINRVKGNVQVIPITYQDSQEIRKFIKTNPVLNKLTLSFITNDSSLMGNKIQFKKIPHEVWVDQNGVIKAITYPDELTKENVEKFIQNELMDIPEKVDVMDFDFNNPLPLDSFYYRSIFGAYKEGAGNILGVDGLYLKNDSVKKFLAVNVPIKSLFYAAYSKNESRFYKNRIELHIKDSLNFDPYFEKKYPSRDVLKKKLYCYELTLPAKIPSDLFFNYVIQEINKFSKFKGVIEKREKDCWIIFNANPAKNPDKSLVGNRLLWERGILKEIQHANISLLAGYLNWNMNIQVVNESDFNTPVDMSFSFDPVSIEDEISFTVESVRKSLNKYGFDIKKEKRFVDVLVIYER